MKLLTKLAIAVVFFIFYPTDTGLAQQTTSESDLRAIIENLMANQPDYEDMEAPLRIAVREQQGYIVEILEAMGSVRSVRFEETERGVDVYFVQFERGRSVWQFARSPNGRVSTLIFNVF